MGTPRPTAGDADADGPTLGSIETGCWSEAMEVAAAAPVAAAAAPPLAAVDLQGWYSFAYEGGEFAVCLRPGGHFFCDEYQQKATWTHYVHADIVLIDWKDYGQYEMRVDPATRSMAGSLRGDPTDWRRATFVKPLSPVETLLLGGKGGGTEWKLEYSGGSFGIQFLGDGKNTMHCPAYPERAYWALDSHGSSNAIEIEWGKYGRYQLTVDAERKSMTGSAKGQPEDWRRASYARDLQPVHGLRVGRAPTYCRAPSCRGEDCEHCPPPAPGA